MIKARVEGLAVTVGGIEQFGIDVQEAAFYGVVEALQKAFEACKTLLSASDHSLRELALMGHPYGFKHPQQIHDPDVIVHAQSGAYIHALRAEPPTAVQGSVISGAIFNDDPKDRWIQEGTIKMRARPWMQYIIDNFGNDFADLIEARINAAIAAHGAA